MPPAKPATFAPWPGWVFQVSGDLPRWLAEDGGSATAEWPEPTSSDRLPIHRSESPTGYSSAGCSPAEPASASPVADNNTSNPGPARQSNCAAQPHCRDTVQVTLLAPVTHGVSSLLCAQGDISILRRQVNQQGWRHRGASRATDPCGCSASTAMPQKGQLPHSGRWAHRVLERALYHLRVCR